MVTIYVERMPWHPRLGANLRRDPRSVAYAYQPRAGITVTSVRHESYIGVLDQGQIGSCTGNAGVSALYHAPFFAAQSNPWPRYSPTEDGALYLYADLTAADGYPGIFTYPPPGGQDTGSDTPTLCQVLTAAGDLSGYQPALDLDSSLAALMQRPGVTGIPWYNSMFDAPSTGLLTVTVSSGLAGGHELCVDEVVAADAAGNGTGQVLVGGPNSWGTGWGKGGRWYLRAKDWWKLRQRNGDVFFWVPATQPAPVPTPPPPAANADATFWAAAQQWARDKNLPPAPTV